jgi:hypothetical protein
VTKKKKHKTTTKKKRSTQRPSTDSTIDETIETEPSQREEISEQEMPEQEQEQQPARHSRKSSVQSSSDSIGIPHHKKKRSSSRKSIDNSVSETTSESPKVELVQLVSKTTIAIDSDGDDSNSSIASHKASNVRKSSKTKLMSVRAESPAPRSPSSQELQSVPIRSRRSASVSLAKSAASNKPSSKDKRVTAAFLSTDAVDQQQQQQSPSLSVSINSTPMRSVSSPLVTSLPSLSSSVSSSSSSALDATEEDVWKAKALALLPEPFPMPVFVQGGSAQEYKQYMLKRYEHEQWQNRVLLLARKLKEETTSSSGQLRRRKSSSAVLGSSSLALPSPSFIEQRTPAVSASSITASSRRLKATDSRSSIHSSDLDEQMLPSDNGNSQIDEDDIDDEDDSSSTATAETSDSMELRSRRPPLQRRTDAQWLQTALELVPEPFPKPTLAESASVLEYKEYMIKRFEYEQWENKVALLVRKMKQEADPSLFSLSLPTTSSPSMPVPFDSLSSQTRLSLDSTDSESRLQQSGANPSPRIRIRSLTLTSSQRSAMQSAIKSQRSPSPDVFSSQPTSIRRKLSLLNRKALTTLSNISPSRQRKQPPSPQIQLLRTSVQSTAAVSATSPLVQRIVKLTSKDNQLKALEELITSETTYMENVRDFKRVSERSDVCVIFLSFTHRCHCYSVVCYTASGHVSFVD